MGAAHKLIEESREVDGVARIERARFAVERYRVTVAPEGGGQVVLALTLEHQRSPSAPWTAVRSGCHRMTPGLARILADLLVLAAARADADQAPSNQAGPGRG